MKKVYPKFLLMLLTLSLLIFFIVGYSLAWFSDLHIINPEIIGEDIIINPEIYFFNENLEKTYPSLENEYLTTHGLIIVDVVNPESINYIDNLRVELKITGTIDFYLRVQIFEEFYKYKSMTEVDPITGLTPPDIGGVERQKIVNYNLFNGDNWFDNRQYDGFYYYKRPTNTNYSKVSFTMPFIEGINNDDNTFPLTVNHTPKWFEGYIVSWNIKVEVVQATRVKQIWELDKLPWE